MSEDHDPNKETVASKDDPVTNGKPPVTNGTITRNKRMCRRKAAFKDDFVTKTANQIKSLRLKSTARTTRVPKLPRPPCKAGTNVVVKGKILQEEPEGLLVMTIQWRGKEYCGCFIDTNKQGWALPRFDDPRVASIAFLKKKAMLLNSDPEETTDDDYSPKTKRKRGGKPIKGKKRKVKNGDISNGKCVKTPTKSKVGRPSNAAKLDRSNSADTISAQPEPAPDQTKAEKSPGPEQTPSENVPEKKPEIEQKSSDQKCDSPKPVIKVPISEKLTPIKCPISISSTVPTIIKQIRPEKTVIIPVGTLPSVPLTTSTSPKTTSPFMSIGLPNNGALVSPLHNQHYPLIVPPPFFIPNFLQSAKFLAERTQSSDTPVNDFSAVFSRDSHPGITTPNTASNVIVSALHQHKFSNNE